ncbi:MAG: hypothetical protein ACI3Z7_03795 [Candidatus Aphodosoma sp.]
MKKFIFAAFVLLLFVSCENHTAGIDKHLIGTWERVSERLHAATPDGVVNEERPDFIKRTMTFKRNWRAVIIDGDETATENYYLGMDAYLQEQKRWGDLMTDWRDDVRYLYIVLPSGESELLDYTVKGDTLFTGPADPEPGGHCTHKYVKVK